MEIYGITSYTHGDGFEDPSDVTFKCFKNEEDRDNDFIRMAQEELDCHEFDEEEWNLKEISTVDQADMFYAKGYELGLSYIQKRVNTSLVG